MSFTKNKFVVIKRVISPELTDFIYKYFLMKRTAAYTLHKNNYFTDEKYYDVCWRQLEKLAEQEGCVMTESFDELYDEDV